ncbi:hypothetical protein PR048_033255 [Dryococelus australis]|uniref:Uncharacterized protein n=1 Tax=Dryococelus australis TaxID=614101 RepID=A0ABQ9FZR2_9NEOP|nr:hypothetical protein PR048_033255 [Dryococelus australis]
MFYGNVQRIQGKAIRNDAKRILSPQIQNTGSLRIPFGFELRGRTNADSTRSFLRQCNKKIIVSAAVKPLRACTGEVVDHVQRAPLTFANGYTSSGCTSPGVETILVVGRSILEAHARAYHLYDDEFGNKQKGTFFPLRRRPVSGPSLSLRGALVRMSSRGGAADSARTRTRTHTHSEISITLHTAYAQLKTNSSADLQAADTFMQFNYYFAYPLDAIYTWTTSQFRVILLGVSSTNWGWDTGFARPMRVKQGEYRTTLECKGGGKREIPEKNPAASSDSIPTCLNLSTTPTGIKPVPHRWGGGGRKSDGHATAAPMSVRSFQSDVTCVIFQRLDNVCLNVGPLSLWYPSNTRMKPSSTLSSFCLRVRFCVLDLCLTEALVAAYGTHTTATELWFRDRSFGNLEVGPSLSQLCDSGEVHAFDHVWTLRIGRRRLGQRSPGGDKQRVDQWLKSSKHTCLLVITNNTIEENAVSFDRVYVYVASVTLELSLHGGGGGGRLSGISKLPGSISRDPDVPTHEFWVIEVRMEQRRNKRPGGTGVPRENPLTNGIVRHDSHMRKSGLSRPGIEPGSPWWEANGLTTRPPLPHPLLRKLWRHAKFALLCGIRLNFTVLYALELESFLHWLLHRGEAKPILTELHVIGAHNCELSLFTGNRSVAYTHYCKNTGSVGVCVRTRHRPIGPYTPDTTLCFTAFIIGRSSTNGDPS